MRVADLQSAETINPVPAAIPGEVEIIALFLAYPERISGIEIRSGEWALLMDGTWYVWAHGRLLPEAQKDEWEEFIGIRFYSYEPGPLMPREITPELSERLRGTAFTPGSDTRIRFNGFLDVLYEISSGAEADRAMRNVKFLGLKTRVHKLLAGPLAEVETEIRESMKNDPAVKAFVDGLMQASSFNWRNISGTLRRSYHSYGVAVDLVPKSYGGKQAYWQWALSAGFREWWAIPLEDRWQLPQAVIDAFEANGFIWGGKWLSFDTMHFEYHPEVYIMNDLRRS